MVVLPVPAPVAQNKSKGVGKKLVTFLTHPLTVIGALLLAKLGLDLFAQHKLDQIKKEETASKEEN